MDCSHPEAEVSTCVNRNGGILAAEWEDVNSEYALLFVVVATLDAEKRSLTSFL